jgi:hypothetical protein
MKILTIVLAVLVVVTAIPAWMPQTREVDKPDDRSGEPIGRSQLSLEEVQSLRVASWDADESSAAVFEVTATKDGWVIPSHHDYPADAKDQVGRTTGSVVGVTYGDLIPVGPDDFGQLELLDPMDDTQSLESEGFGTRITIKDKSGANVVDLIVGDNVEGASGVRYVRDAGSNAVYTAKLNIMFSTKFTDWVNRKLIDVEQADIKQLVIDRHMVDEGQGAVEQGEKQMFSRVDVDNWTTAEVPEGQGLAVDKVKDVLRKVTSLNLVGVRPFPTGGDLLAKLRLQAHGLFQAQNGQLYGNDGAIAIGTKEGMRYHLFFGEIAAGTGKDLSAGQLLSEEEAQALIDDNEAKEGNNRYMAIFVRYDPELDENYVAAKNAAEAPEATEGEEAAATDEEKQDMDPQAIANEGKAKAAELNARFTKYFYVIDNASFEKLKPSESDLFKEVEKQEEPAADDAE